MTDVFTMKTFSNVETAFEAMKKRASGIIPNVILAEGAITAANFAAVRSNPNAGSFRMFKGAAEKNRVMNRPVIKLSELVKKGKVGRFTSSAEDESAYTSGMRWKVVNTKVKAAPAFAYTKTLSEANRAKVIHTRGLLRAAWGISLTTVGARLPRAVQYVIRDNPFIMKYANAVSDARIVQDNDSKYIVIDNKAPFSVSYKTYVKGAAEQVGNKRIVMLMLKEGPFRQVFRRLLNEAPMKAVNAQTMRAS